MTMTKLTINIKTIIEKTKRGWNLESIANHFGFDAESFETNLRKKFGDEKANELLENIKKNNKKKNSTKKSGTKKTKKVSHASVETSCSKVENEISDSEEEVKETPKICLEDLKLSIQQTEKMISELNEEIVVSEKERKKCLSQKNHLRKQIEKIKEDLEIIEKSLVSKKELFTSILNEMNQLSAQASDYHLKAKEKSEEVEEINKRLKNLKKITILVLNNGEIQDENGNEIITSIDSSDISYQMFYDENIENLTVKEVKQLSKLLSIIKELMASQIDFEILFDSSSLESVFNKTVVL